MIERALDGGIIKFFQRLHDFVIDFAPLTVRGTEFAYSKKFGQNGVCHVGDDTFGKLE